MRISDKYILVVRQAVVTTSLLSLNKCLSVRWDTNGWLISDDWDRGKVECDVHHVGTLEKDVWVTGRESRTERRSHRRTSTC